MDEEKSVVLTENENKLRKDIVVFKRREDPIENDDSIENLKYCYDYSDNCAGKINFFLLNKMNEIINSFISNPSDIKYTAEEDCVRLDNGFYEIVIFAKCINYLWALPISMFLYFSMYPSTKIKVVIKNLKSKKELVFFKNVYFMFSFDNSIECAFEVRNFGATVYRGSIESSLESLDYIGLNYFHKTIIGLIVLTQKLKLKILHEQEKQEKQEKLKEIKKCKSFKKKFIQNLMSFN